MSSFNRVIILGNLGRDPEIRYTANQTPVATLSVATTDYRTVDGQRQDQTEWHRVVVWGKQAETCSKYLAKGRSVFIEGKLQTRSWDDKETGQKKYSTEVVAQNVRFVGGSRSEGSSYGQSNEGYDEMIGSASQGGLSGDYGAPGTPSMDDIPF